MSAGIASRGPFSLSEIELERLREWLSGKENVYVGPIDGRFEFVFTPTTIGTSCKVFDTVLKDCIDVTDYECW